MSISIKRPPAQVRRGTRRRARESDASEKEMAITPIAMPVARMHASSMWTRLHGGRAQHLKKNCEALIASLMVRRLDQSFVTTRYVIPVTRVSHSDCTLYLNSSTLIPSPAAPNPVQQFASRIGLFVMETKPPLLATPAPSASPKGIA